MKTLLIKKPFKGDIHVALTSDELSEIDKNTNVTKEEKVELGGGFKPVNCEPEAKEEPKAVEPEVKEQA